MRRLALRSLAGRSVTATALLLVIGAIIAPSTVSASAFLSLLPFVAILAVASIGQHLVIQQRGLDISIAGIMSFAAVIVTALPSSGATISEVAGYIVLALFNLLPAFPMDGGRVLRSLMAMRMNSYARATEIAARIGRVLAVVLGVAGLYVRNPFWVLIAIFVWTGAGSEARAALHAAPES